MLMDSPTCNIAQHSGQKGSLAMLNSLSFEGESFWRDLDDPADHTFFSKAVVYIALLAEALKV